MEVAEVIAMGFRYPAPGVIDRLAAAVESTTQGGIKRHMTHFIAELQSLTIGEWEELHTVTLDLSPLFIPYVGHVKWGENYRRGEFMADLNAAMNEASVDLEGELPDHIAPILRYIAVTAEPQADLIEVLPETVATMAKTLARAAAKNPYRHLLGAAVDFTADLAARFPAPAQRQSLLRRNGAEPEPPGVAVQVGRRRSDD